MAITTLGSNVPATGVAIYDLGYVWRTCLVAAMGGLLFGYVWVVVGGATPFVEAYFGLTSDAIRGWANSCAVVGCLIGSAISGVCADRFGRKRLLLLAAVLFATSSILTGCAQTFSAFVVWRIVAGVAIGLASNLSPMYIAELTPASLRGRFVSINQMAIVIGVLGAQLINYLIADDVAQGVTAQMLRESWNGQFGWRWMFAAATVPSLIFLVGALSVPESPRWLAGRGQHELARKILARIGGGAYAKEELESIEQALSQERRPAEGGAERTGFQELFAPRTRGVLMIGMVLAVLQQWCGIDVVFIYAEDIFRGAGFGVGSVLINTVITGVVLLMFTVVAVLKVDQVGRRALMLVGCAGVGAFHVLIGLSYEFDLRGMIVIAPVLGAIACYAFSLAPVTWVLISEIFPNRIRGLAMSVTVGVLWVGSFVLIYTFPLLQSALGVAGVFWLYGAICAAGYVFILRRVPETKGKSLEQVERELGCQP